MDAPVSGGRLCEKKNRIDDKKGKPWALKRIRDGEIEM